MLNFIYYLPNNLQSTFCRSYCHKILLKAFEIRIMNLDDILKFFNNSFNIQEIF